MKLTLREADDCVDRLKCELLKVPGVERVEAAGSVRRRRPMPNDIDLVVLAKDTHAVLERLSRPVGWRMDIQGTTNARVFTRTAVQIDIFFARMPEADMFTPRPTNWGSVLLCRTGSIAHNIELIQHAERLNMRWDPQDGVYDEKNNLVASETEEQIFEALGLPCVPPEKRETWRPI